MKRLLTIIHYQSPSRQIRKKALPWKWLRLLLDWLTWKPEHRELALQAAAESPSWWDRIQNNVKNTFKWDIADPRQDLFRMRQENMRKAYSGALVGAEQIEQDIEGYKELQRQITRTENLNAKMGIGGVTPVTIKDPNKKGPQNPGRKSSGYPGEKTSRCPSAGDGGRKNRLRKAGSCFCR